MTQAQGSEVNPHTYTQIFPPVFILCGVRTGLGAFNITPGSRRKVRKRGRKQNRERFTSFWAWGSDGNRKAKSGKMYFLCAVLERNHKKCICVCERQKAGVEVKRIYTSSQLYIWSESDRKTTHFPSLTLIQTVLPYTVSVCGSYTVVCVWLYSHGSGQYTDRRCWVAGQRNNKEDLRRSV